MQDLMTSVSMDLTEKLWSLLWVMGVFLEKEPMEFFWRLVGVGAEEALRPNSGFWFLGNELLLLVVLALPLPRLVVLPEVDFPGSEYYEFPFNLEAEIYCYCC